MTVDEALKLADKCSEGMTFYHGHVGKELALAVLAAEVRRNRKELTRVVILESDIEDLQKIKPDVHGGYNLFFRCGSNWSWDDSIGEETRNTLIDGAHRVYGEIERG